MTENKKRRSKTPSQKYDNFTLSLALFDALPVLFFCIGMLLIASRFQNAFFVAGVVLCTLAGCGKVLWKILVAGTGRDLVLLNRQLRVLMPLGFCSILLGLITGRDAISVEGILTRALAFPSVIFFGITVLGMIFMMIFAFTLDGTKAKSNWIEQITNATTQGCLLLGILTMLY